MVLLPKKLDRPLNIFYGEPDPDRWLPYDRYPRRLIRRIVRGKTRPGGVMMVALNLMQGLDKLRIPYRFNDYKYIDQHPNEVACIIGKPHLLEEHKWKNPIVFGAGIFSHPSDDPNILQRHPHIKRLLVPGDWMQLMFQPFYGDLVQAWPTGIDTQKWQPANTDKTIDFIVYDKIRWERDKYVPHLLDPILKQLEAANLTYQVLRYGNYAPADLQVALSKAKAAIFLCEHESQGLAYQQILSCDIPILAWDRGGYWQDPNYYPRVKFGPVSSVPYWDERFGLKFTSKDDFVQQLATFLQMQKDERFKPREYILENLSLEKCAADYVDIIRTVEKELAG